MSDFDVASLEKQQQKHATTFGAKLSVSNPASISDTNSFARSGNMRPSGWRVEPRATSKPHLQRDPFHSSRIRGLERRFLCGFPLFFSLLVLF